MNDLSIDEIMHELNVNAKLLYVFALEPGQTLPDLAFTTNNTLSPKLMKHFGKLRKLTWEASGVNVRDKEEDLDRHDLRNNRPYDSYAIFRQPQKTTLQPQTTIEGGFLGGYRYLIPDEETTIDQIADTEVFLPTEKYVEEVFPTSISLGRAFVIPDKQLSRTFSKLYMVLARLKDLNSDKQISSFSGKLTTPLPKNFHQVYLRDVVLTFLDILYNKGYMQAREPMEYVNQLHLTQGDEDAFINLFKKTLTANSTYINGLCWTYYQTAKNPREASKLKTFGHGIYPCHEKNTSGYDSIETSIMIKFSDFSKKKQELFIRPIEEQRSLQDDVAASDYDLFRGIKPLQK